MIKKISLLFFSFSLLFANEIVYTQNNPPGQHLVLRKYLVLFNADLLVGKVQIPNFSYANLDIVQNGAQIQTFRHYELKDTPKLGFLVGIGYALNTYLNASLQFRWMQSGNLDAHTTPRIFTSLEIGIADKMTFTGPSPVTFSSRLKAYLLIADFLVQTSYWMTGKLRFQPLAGLRLQRKKNDHFLHASSSTQSYQENSFQRQNRFGILIGTDIQFIINRYLYFFTTLLTQITTSTKDTTVSKVTKITTNTTVRDFFDRNTLINNIHQWEYRFGLGWQHNFTKWLLSLRLFYELKENTYEAYGCGVTTIF